MNIIGGEYAQFFKNLMQYYVAKSTKNVIMTAHVADQLNEKEGVMETFVKVKGSLMNNGIESYFSNIVMCERIKLKDLEKSGSENPLLNMDEYSGNKGKEFKYVFRTRETADSRVRASFGMWDKNEEFIDNNIQNVLNRLHEYYDD